MTATLGTLLSRARNRLNEPTARHWTDAQLREWLQEGAREIARVAECLLASSNVSVTANTRSYSLSALSPQPVRLHRAEWTASGSTQRYPLQYRDFTSMDEVWGTSQAITPGTPSFWTTWGYFPSMTVYLYPVPSQNGTLTLFYYRFPTAIATDGSGDSSVVECPDGWEDCAVDYCEQRALRQDGDNRWQAAKAEFDERLGNLMRTTQRPVDGMGFITTDQGFVPGWLANEW